MIGLIVMSKKFDQFRHAQSKAITMQGFMFLAILGTEKDTLVFYSTEIVGRQTNGRKVEPHLALSRCDKKSGFLIQQLK